MHKTKSQGQIAVELLFLSAIIVSLIAGFVSLAASLLQVSVRGQNKLEAFSIAEAGIEYYTWHLAYAPEDFTDGTGHAGPYVHPYYDKNGNQIGDFSLDIGAPTSGSTIVTITSTGNVLADSSVVKTIKVKVGIPSFAQYAWVLNSNVNFGTTAVVNGVIDSNKGIHFDGIAHNLVESALTTYVDPDIGKTEWAVYTDNNPADPRPPTALPSRPDVFTAGRKVGVPAIDFAGITEDLATIESQAQATGYYASSSGAYGYDLALASTTFSVYKVTSLVKTPSRSCRDYADEDGWGTWSIKTETLYATGTIPEEGDMFFSDNLWVRGQIDGAHVTIASGVFPDNPSTETSITVNNSLKYTSFDGSDTIALIAQKNINVGLMSDDDLTIDAALIAQNGWIGRYDYEYPCGSTSDRSQLTTFGILASNQQSGFYYDSQDGYQNRTYNYDSNLLYAPPPSFPLTTDTYSLISWEEVQ